MKPWNASNSSVVVVGLLLIMLNGTLNANLLILLCYCWLSLRHLTDFCTIFFNFGKFVKIREFFLLRTNSRSMPSTVHVLLALWYSHHFSTYVHISSIFILAGLAPACGHFFSITLRLLPFCQLFWPDVSQLSSIRKHLLMKTCSLSYHLQYDCHRFVTQKKGRLNSQR